MTEGRPAGPVAGDDLDVHPRRSPFTPTVPAIVSAVLFGVAALVWLLAGRWLPGGRWVVIHLFTLGVLTTLITAFTRHFATTFTGQGVHTDRRRPVLAALVLDASVVALLVGRLIDGRVLLALGTVGLLGVIGTNLLALRRARRGARTDRFVWIVRRYEDAHLAFLAGAVAGTTVGIGLVGGGWWAGVRDAHVHLNVLGWAGLTVLATVVVFGPAILRARMTPRAAEHAARALRTAALALLVAVTALIVAAGGAGVVSSAGRGVAVVALTTYGIAVVVVMRAVLRSATASPRSPVRWPVTAVALWFPVGVAIDVVAVATDQRRAFDLVGVVVFVGVLAQLILAVLLHLAPQLRAGDRDRREAITSLTERGAVPRTIVLNVGVLLVAVAIGAGMVSEVSTVVITRVGWATVAMAVLAHLVPVVAPVGRRTSS